VNWSRRDTGLCRKALLLRAAMAKAHDQTQWFIEVATPPNPGQAKRLDHGHECLGHPLPEQGFR